MTERLKSSPDTKVDWEHILEEALTMPGAAGRSYNRFYNYSFLNQTLLHMQGVSEPVATYKKWAELGRQVQKGAKAKSILRPVAYKEVQPDGLIESMVKGFKMVRCLFPFSDTEGDELPEYEPPEWSEPRALGELAIKKVQFEEINGNINGYSYERNVAVSPVAPYPFKTLIHEVAHVELGHTIPRGLIPRGIIEFQAESTAYLVLNELEAEDQMDKPESRDYITSWLRGETPDDTAIKQVFSATDKILKAGRS